MIDHVEAINCLNGSYFRLWGYTPTHDRLTVALNSTGLGNKLLFFFCEKLHFDNQSTINNAKLIKKVQTLIFSADGIEIECQEIHLMTEDNQSIWCMNFLNDGEFNCSQVKLNDT